MGRTPRGQIAVVVEKERVKLRFPRPWFGGKQKYLCLDLPATEQNLLFARTKAQTIELEYLMGKFDCTLDSYRPQHEQLLQPHKITLSELWGQYCAYKSRRLKPKTLYYWVSTLGRWIDRCPHQDLDKSLEIRDWMLGATTEGMAERILAALPSALNWGIKHNLVAFGSNQFVGMAQDLGLEKSEPRPNAFSPQEKEETISAFINHDHYCYYARLVDFWFLTGCRPSEAIGLEWEQINDCGNRIKFDRSIVRIAGKAVKNNRSKTNRVRTFKCQPELQELLLELRSKRSANSLVFPSQSGAPIYYENFARGGWVKVVEPIVNRPTTPYSCRDTFITQQLAAGKPIAIVAKWVDNSPQMIESRYLDMEAIDDLLPD